MNNSKKAVSAVFVGLFLAFLFVFGAWVLLKTPDTLSESERRALAKPPELSYETLSSGTFFTKGEDYLLDQFPFRDAFRSLKSLNLYYVFRQSDSHNIVLKGGHAAEITADLSDEAVSTYLKRINMLYQRHLKRLNVNIYSTVIPDKMAFLADKYGIPSIDYDKLQSTVAEGMPGKYIDIFDTLDIDSYYTTDTHWSQDKIIGTANKLLSEMGAAPVGGTYIKGTLSPFYGVYYGRSALPLPPDTISTVGGDLIDSAKAYWSDRVTGKLIDSVIYNEENITANDPYDVFLSGAATIYMLDNTKVEGGKTLYLFSDSFGRSLLPLLLSDYDKVVMYDIRYSKASFLLNILPIEAGSDVLIAYSITSIDGSSSIQAD